MKVRYGDRTTITRSHTVGARRRLPRAIGAVAGALLDAVDVSPGVRLLGVSVSGLDTRRPRPPAVVRRRCPRTGAGAAGAVPRGAATGRSDDSRPTVGTRRRGELAWDEVEAAVTAIRARYGHASVGPAALVGRDGLAVKERGDTQWGPTRRRPRTVRGDERTRVGDVPRAPRGPVPRFDQGLDLRQGRGTESAERRGRRCLALRRCLRLRSARHVAAGPGRG